jgi:hypothetical protein
MKIYLSAKSESDDRLASSSPRRSEECFPLTVFENTGKCKICKTRYKIKECPSSHEEEVSKTKTA